MTPTGGAGRRAALAPGLGGAGMGGELMANIAALAPAPTTSPATPAPIAIHAGCRRAGSVKPTRRRQRRPASWFETTAWAGRFVSAPLFLSPMPLPSFSSVVIVSSHFGRFSIPRTLGSKFEVNLKKTRSGRFFRPISGKWR